jgi:multidrug resistance efflux pump
MEDPIKKAQAELAEAARNLNRYLNLVSAGMVAQPAEVSTTIVFKTLKDAMNRVEFMARAAATAEAEGATSLVL